MFSFLAVSVKVVFMADITNGSWLSVITGRAKNKKSPPTHASKERSKRMVLFLLNEGSNCMQGRIISGLNYSIKVDKYESHCNISDILKVPLYINYVWRCIYTLIN